MDKPKKYIKTYWNYHEVIRFIEQKYDIKERDREKRQDFWRWLLGDVGEIEYCYDISNGQIFTLYLEDELKGNPPDWVRHILQLIYDEFKEDNMEFLVEW